MKWQTYFILKMDVLMSEVRVFAHKPLKELQLDCEYEYMFDVFEWYSPQHLEAYA